MTIAISISAIIAGIYADTALACRSGSDCPALLHRDHERALRRIACDAFAAHTLGLLPLLDDVHIPEDDSDDILSVDIAEQSCRSAPPTPVLSQYLTSGVTYRMLHIVYAGDDDCRSNAYLSLAETASENFSATLSGAAAADAIACRLRPSV